MAFGAAGRQRQHAVFAIKRLDSCLLVHAEHGRMRGRVQIQADHIRRLGLEVRVVGDQVAIQPMRLQTVLAPDALNGRERDVAQLGRQLAAAPMRGAIRRFVLDRLVQHSRLQLGHRPLWRTARMQRHQPGQPLKLKCPRPAGHEAVVAGELGSDVHAPLPIGPQQHATRTPRQGGTAVTLADHRLEFVALLLGQLHSVHALQHGAYTADFNASVD
jgi:hypothetical protein